MVHFLLNIFDSNPIFKFFQKDLEQLNFYKFIYKFIYFLINLPK